MLYYGGAFHDYLIVLGTLYDIRILCFGGLGVKCLFSQYLGDGSRGIRNSGHPQGFVEFKSSLSYRRHCFKKEESEEAKEEKPLPQACCRCTVTFATSLL